MGGRPVELTQLEELVAIADAGTMSGAAERLHISQPAVSRSIRQLEVELGHDLFDRTRNRAELNDAGKLACEDARRVLAAVQALRDDLDEQAKRARTVRVASCAPAPMWRLAELAVASFPGTILSTEYLDESDIERALLNREVDLAILKRPLALPNIQTEQIMEETLSVEVPQDDELASRNHVSWEDLDGRTFLIFEAIGFWMDVVHEHLPNSQFITQSDPRVFEQLVSTTTLSSFVTDISRFERTAGMRKRIPIWGPDVTATYYLAAQKDAGTQVRELQNLFAS